LDATGSAAEARTPRREPTALTPRTEGDAHTEAIASMKVRDEEPSSLRDHQ
jgi:hypothetical protein|tara:strand:- start:3071 stop:3223 length:153 start_codon:yes stop_codon:yes gene_type:complete